MDTNKLALDVTKPVQTRDGRKARIVCTDRANPSGRSILALVSTSEAKASVEENALGYYRTGCLFINSETSHDLVNVPETRHEFQNIYNNGRGYVMRHSTLEDANRAANGEVSASYRNSAKHIGILKFTFIDDKLTAVELLSPLPEASSS